MEKKVTRPAATTTKTIQTPPVTLSQNEMELNNLKPKLAGGVNGKLIGPTTPLTTTPKGERCNNFIEKGNRHRNFVNYF